MPLHYRFCAGLCFEIFFFEASKEQGAQLCYFARNRKAKKKTPLKKKGVSSIFKKKLHRPKSVAKDADGFFECRVVVRRRNEAGFVGRWREENAVFKGVPEEFFGVFRIGVCRFL